MAIVRNLIDIWISWNERYRGRERGEWEREKEGGKKGIKERGEGTKRGRQEGGGKGVRERDR